MKNSSSEVGVIRIEVCDDCYEKGPHPEMEVAEEEQCPGFLQEASYVCFSCGPFCTLCGAHAAAHHAQNHNVILMGPDTEYLRFGDFSTIRDDGGMKDRMLKGIAGV